MNKSQQFDTDTSKVCILLHNKQFLWLKENDSEYGQQK